MILASKSQELNTNMTVFIYIIRNSQTNKCYIGITQRKLQTRFAEHWRYALAMPDRNYWTRSLIKYGKAAFKIELLEKAENEAEAKKREVALIEQYGTIVPYGYNSTSGGEGSFNPSDELREKLSINKLGNNWNVGRQHSEEFKQKCSDRWKGKKKPKKQRKKISKAAKENWKRKNGIF